ncbi:MAG: MmgE/PrpD family protein [Hyphomicrobiales bacterium]|nr:MmgE/PrpD family protein [Hyphomicrobiales bacterium]
MNNDTFIDPGHGAATSELAAFIAGFDGRELPAAVHEKTTDVVLDGTAALLAATDPLISTGSILGDLVGAFSGSGRASLVGRNMRVDPVSAALFNGTLGYTCDVEPFHPGGVLHPIAVLIPAALAAAEHAGASGARLMGAVALGCEVEYRVSMALGPVEQYNLGFHPSAVCGAFGAAAAAAHVLGLDTDAAERALGLAACQASGLMAWESDRTENARPFQMGMAARNGLTAAFLAREGFGGPRDVFDRGHTVLRAFSRNPDPDQLTAGLAEQWDGVLQLAIKPYSCVAFLQPAIDALKKIRADHGVSIEQIDSIACRFPSSGTHCIDNNPLKSHCAQYILPVAMTATGLQIRDLFFDRRETDAFVARLSRNVRVVKDDVLEKEFPKRYATVIELTTTDGHRYDQRQDITRGYPDAPLSREEIMDKFRHIAAPVVSPSRAGRIRTEAERLWEAPSIDAYADLLRAAPDA